MGPDASDLSLVRRVQRGERGAYDLLVLKYQHKVVKLVMRYLLGGQRPERSDLAALIECIRGDSRIMSTAARDGNLPPGPALQDMLVPGGTAERS